MWRILIPALLLAACAQLPPPAGDTAAKRFESIPDKSVIYIARQLLDSYADRALRLDDKVTITTSRGTYYRWEAAPGTHRIAAPGGAESVTLTTAPGKIYFVEHTVLTDPRDGQVTYTGLQEISDQAGRELVSRGQLLR